MLNLSLYVKPFSTIVRNNCNRAWIGKIRRGTYARIYPTLLVFPNGSTIKIRHHEPRAIIKLPLDLSQLTDNEKKVRLMKRQPKVIRKIVDDLEDDFKISEYDHLWKKK